MGSKAHLERFASLSADHGALDTNIHRMERGELDGRPEAREISSYPLALRRNGAIMPVSKSEGWGRGTY